MEAVLICFGVVPWLSGRTTLALGLLFAWFALKGMWSSNEVSVRAGLMGIAAGLLAIGVQYAIDRGRAALLSLLEPINVWLRRFDAVVAALVAAGFAFYFLGLIAPRPTPAVALAGLDGSTAVVVAVALLAYAFAWVRGWIASLFARVPLSDERGVRGLLFVTEALATVAGLALAFALPIVGAIVAGLSLVALVAAGLTLRKLARGARTACAACGADVHVEARRCPKCQADRVPARKRDAVALLAGRRCPQCAERVSRRDGAVVCGTCGVRPFAREEDARAFVRHADQRLMALAPVIGALGLIPVLGLALGLVVWKLSAAGALATYVGFGDRLRTRLLHALGLGALALIQPVPVVGVAAALGVVGATHFWTRTALIKR